MSVPSRVVFLDFDGVLNSEHWARTRPWAIDVQIDPGAVERLLRLCNETGAAVVVSSSWRLFYGESELRAILFAFGFTSHRIIGTTPDLSRRSWIEHPEGRACRGDGIKAWLDEQPAVESFVILDDDDDMGPVADRLVQTSWQTGLLDEHVDRAIAMLR